MALDSLGLGLTLDTTLLEKADKTLENMQKNSKLIMQNLTRGFTAFNEGKIGDFAKVFDSISKSMQKLKDTKVSLDFDTNGLERGLDLISQITLSIEKMAAAGTKQFFDPTNIYTTSKSMKEAADEVSRLKNELDAVHKAMHDMVGTQEELNALIAKRAEIKLHNPSTFTENQEFMDALARVDEINKAKAAAEAKYGDMEGARMAERRLIESIEIAKKELEWTKMTKAQQMAAVVSYNQKIIADEKKRASEVESLYKNNFTKMNELFKQIKQLENDRAQIEAVGGDTSEYDKNLAFLRDELDRRMKLEEEIVKSDYPKIAKIKQEMETEEFIKASKERARLAEQEQRRDVSYANKVSKNASSVEEEAEAVRLLAEARDKLSYSTAHYDQIVAALNKRIAKHEDHIKLLTHEQKESNTLMDSVISRYIREKKEIRELNKLLKELHEKQASTGVKTAEEDKYEQDIIARRQRLWNDVNQIETDNAKHIAQLREKFEASVAEEKVKEILKTNEREKQEYAKLLDDLYAIEKQKKAMEEVGGGAGDAAYDNLLQQEADLNARKSQLEATHQNDLDEIRKKHAKERNDDEVKAFIDAEKEMRKVAEENAKKMKEEWEKYGVVGVPEANAAIRNNRNAENIAQHKRAIEELQKVRSLLDNTDRRYYDTLKDLNREIHSHELFIRAAENESVRLSNSHRGLMDISGQLMRRLALVFSVSQMTQYFRKLVEVRGQFEKTEVALTSIVGSQEKSNKLMNQTIALAIKSPYTLQQLTGYTKQLAAYQVEYKDLYNTTKMLADVSSGLGVEMDRLILAFGQVKAANYLRATEVRQFTEAGFNILGELAKYYTELEGTMVSVGDVQERVTKRMVDFADVEEIFRRVTSAGGMFYDMQSRQAETLAGQWTNLQDRIDVMLNEIGTSGEGILKFVVKFLASAIDNWEVLASSIKTAVAAFIIFKTYSLLAGDGIKLLAIQMGVLTNSVPKVLTLGQAFKTLSRVVSSSVTKMGASMSALLTNPIFLAVAAIGALIGAGVSLYRHFDKMSDALKEQSDSFNEYTSSLKKLSTEYNKLDKFTEKLAKLEELKGRLNERGLKLSVEMDEVNTDNIDQAFAESAEILQKSYDLGLSVGKAITKGINAAQGNIFGLSTFGENLAEDAEDFAAKWNKLASYGMDAQMRAMENEIEANQYASEEALAIYETIKEGRKAQYDENGKIVKYLESEYEWTMRRAEALRDIQNLDDGSVTRNGKLARYIRQVTRHEKELNHEVDNTINKLAKEFGGIENLMKAAKDNPVEFSAAIQAEVDKQAWDEVTKWVYNQKLHARLDITPNYVEDPNAVVGDKFKNFQQDLIDARGRLKEGGKSYENFFISEEEIKKMEDFSDGLEGIQKLYDENKKTIEQLEGTKGAYNKEEMARLNALQKELRAVAKLWGYDLDLKGKGGESEALKNLKDQIKLIRDANKAYEERNKKFGKEASKSVVTDSYKDAFKEVELAIEDIDYTNLEGVVKALEDLEDEAKKAGGTTELLKAISEVKAEIGLTLKEKQDRELFDQVQEIFDQYELAVDIKKLNIPPELVKNIFGVDTKSFDQMREEIISKFAGGSKEVTEILSKGAVLSAEDEQTLINLIGKERVDEAKKAIEKIDDLEEKQQLESATRFAKFLTKNLDQTKVIMSQRGIDIAFAKKEFDEGKISAEQFAETVKNIVAQSNEKISKFNLDKFKESPEYIQAMGDLTAYTVTELKTLKNSLKAIISANGQAFTADEMKAYSDALENVTENINKLEDRPFFKDEDIHALKEIKRINKEIDDAKKAEATLNQTLITQEAERARLVAQLSILETQRENTKKAGGDTTAIDQQIISLASQIEDINSKILVTQGQIKNSKVTLADLGAELKTILGDETTAIAKLNAWVGIFTKSLNVFTEVYAEVKDLAASFGADTESGAWKQTDNVLGMLQGFGSNALSAASKITTDPLGAAIDGVKAIFEVIKGINAIHDDALETKIQDHLDNVEDLQKDYERLGRAIDKAFAFERYGKVAEQADNLGEQVQNLNKAIALEEDKKNTDPERIEELKGQVEDIENQIEDLFDNLKQDLIGSFEDMGDSLADAMIEALKAGEDGIAAWNEEVDEIIAELVKKLTVQKYLEPQISAAIDTLFSRMMPKTAAAEKAAEQYGAASDEAVAAYKKAEGEIPQLDEKDAEEFKKKLELIGLSYEEFAKMIAGITGGEGGGLSALEKGIQGMSEDTAQVLAAYWNSVRGYTASIDSKMDLILANMGLSSSDENPMLSQLRLMASQTKAINDLLSSVTAQSSGRGGTGIKVYFADSKL